MYVRSAMVMVLLGLATLLGRSALAQEAVSTEEMVDALNSVYGSHKGYRAAHAKGFCAAGTFQATAEAADMSKASIFDGRAVPTMFRFSLAPGTPEASDLEQAPRSLVARFEPAGGETMDLIMINVPFVFMDEPADFVPFLRALAPDPATGQPDAAKLKAHLDAHPEAKRFVEFLDQAPVPASYAQAPYFAVHTFYFTNARGARRPARWIAEPVAGEAALTEEQAKSLTPNFLQEELRQRVEKAPVAWDLYLQFPEPGDPLDDASVAWPKDRTKVKVGQLQVTSVEPAGNKGPCDEIMFDPTLLVEGIDPSDDPVLLIRPEAYAVSFSRRMTP